MCNVSYDIKDMQFVFYFINNIDMFNSLSRTSQKGILINAAGLLIYSND